MVLGKMGGTGVGPGRFVLSPSAGCWGSASLLQCRGRTELSPSPFPPVEQQQGSEQDTHDSSAVRPTNSSCAPLDDGGCQLGSPTILTLSLPPRSPVPSMCISSLEHSPNPILSIPKVSQEHPPTFLLSKPF